MRSSHWRKNSGCRTKDVGSSGWQSVILAGTLQIEGQVKLQKTHGSQVCENSMGKGHSPPYFVDFQARHSEARTVDIATVMRAGDVDNNLEDEIRKWGRGVRGCEENKRGKETPLVYLQWIPRRPRFYLHPLSQRQGSPIL